MPGYRRRLPNVRTLTPSTGYGVTIPPSNSRRPAALAARTADNLQFAVSPRGLRSDGPIEPLSEPQDLGHCGVRRVACIGNDLAVSRNMRLQRCHRVVYRLMELAATIEQIGDIVCIGVSGDCLAELQMVAAEHGRM